MTPRTPRLAHTSTPARTPRTAMALAVLGLALLSACATVPAPNAQLTQARADYRNAEGDPRAQRMAPAEMKQAQEALQTANAAWERNDPTDGINHLAYLARQRVAIAQETMAQRSAELASGNASATRNDIRLEARTQEADNAQRQADRALRTTDLALADTADAQRQADTLQAQNRLLQERLRELNAKPSPRGIVLTLGDVLFDSDKSQLKLSGQRLVQQLAVVLYEYPQRTVLIEGFTDSTGPEAHNMALSGQRAEAVRAALQGEGVAPARMATRAHGESHPVAGNDSADGRELNRRVEIIFSNGQGLILAR